MKIIEIKANQKMKIDIRISIEDKHGFFEVQEERIVLLSDGQSFIGLIDSNDDKKEKEKEEEDKK